MLNAHAIARRFKRDETGNAAIEFGILAPLLMLLLLGTIELGRAINADRHFIAAVTTVGDLVAREAYIGTSSEAATSNLEGMMLSINHLMRPYDPSKLKLAVYSVKASAEDANKAKVEWVYSHNEMEVQAKCSDYTLPPDIVAKGGSVIVIDATYKYSSLFGSYILASDVPWEEKSFHNPRNSCVDYVKGDNCMSQC